MTQGADVAPEIPHLALVHGVESFLIDAKVADWRRRAETLSEVMMIRAPGTLKEVSDALGTPSLFADTHVVLLVDPAQAAERPTKAAGTPGDLGRLLATASPEAYVCVQVHHLLPLTSPLLAAVGAAGGVVSAYPTMRQAEVRAWLVEVVRRRGVKLPDGGIDHLLGCAGRDLSTLNSEVAKLAAYGATTPITLEALRRLVAGNEQVAVWDVLDRLVEGSHGAGAAAMGALLDGGASPVSLISVLSGQISDLLLVRQMIQAGSGGPDDVAREMGVPRWRADRLCRQARQVRGGQLARWLRSLHRLDVQLKDGRISGADGVRSLGLAMAASFEGRGL